MSTENFLDPPCDVEGKFDDLIVFGAGDPPPHKKIDYRFNEPALIEELRRYVDATYSEHYASGPNDIKPIQTNEFIMSQCTTTEPLKHSVMKYAARYGKKDGYNRKDLLKILHYALIWLNYHDKFYGKKK